MPCQFEAPPPLDEDNILLSILLRRGSSAAAAGLSRDGAIKAIRRDDDGNENGGSPDSSYLKELEEIVHLPALFISLARTAQTSGPSVFEWGPSGLGPSSPAEETQIDEQHSLFFNFG